MKDTFGDETADFIAPEEAPAVVLHGTVVQAVFGQEDDVFFEVVDGTRSILEAVYA